MSTAPKDRHPYIPKTATLTCVTIKADKTWENNRHKAARRMQGGEICHWQNAVGKGMRRFGKKLCKQGSPYKKLQKSAGSAIVQNRLMPCWDKTKPSWDRQAAGLHTEFGVQAALRAPHRQIPQGASPRHEYPSFATVHSRGEIQAFSSF